MEEEAAKGPLQPKSLKCFVKGPDIEAFCPLLDGIWDSVQDHWRAVLRLFDVSGFRSLIFQGFRKRNLTYRLVGPSGPLGWIAGRDK